MKIVSAEFVAAASKPADIPVARHPELALAGRSNVGKSSLINRLTARKKLARTSQTPGCTRGLIFFEINESLTLVDLPGYGWARRSQAERRSWKKLVEAYLTARPSLAGVLILIDARRGPEEEERQLARFLEAHSIPLSWVATKCDKLARAKLNARLVELEAELDGRVVLATSAKTGFGIGHLWDWIHDASDAAGRVP